MAIQTIPQSLSRRAEAVGYKLSIDPDCDGINVDKIDDTEPSLGGGSLAEAERFIAEIETGGTKLNDDERASVSAFLNHMMWLRGCEPDDSDELGKLVVQRLATACGPVTLTLNDCANVLEYLSNVEPANNDHALHWGEAGSCDGGHMVYGLNLILESVRDRLRAPQGKVLPAKPSEAKVFADADNNGKNARLLNGTETERFLNLIVTAGCEDRLKAMQIRETEGVTAALEFIGGCNITDEHLPTATESQTSLSQVQDLFQGIEATAKLLSLHVDTADLNTDLVAYCMTMAREAERGVHLVGDLIEGVEETEEQEFDRLIADATDAHRVCVLRLMKLGYTLFTRETDGGYGGEHVILDSDRHVMAHIESDGLQNEVSILEASATTYSESASLADRVSALGLELFETADGRQLVLDGVDVVFLHRNDDDEPIERWLESRES